MLIIFSFYDNDENIRLGGVNVIIINFYELSKGVKFSNFIEI